MWQREHRAWQPGLWPLLLPGRQGWVGGWWLCRGRGSLCWRSPVLQPQRLLPLQAGVVQASEDLDFGLPLLFAAVKSVTAVRLALGCPDGHASNVPKTP